MKKIASLAAGLFAPALAFAQVNTVNTSYTQSIMLWIKDIIAFLFPALTAIAVIVFIVMMIRFITAEAGEKEKQRKGLISSVVALFIILSITGIIRLIQNATGTGGENRIDSTQVPVVDFQW